MDQEIKIMHAVNKNELKPAECVKAHLSSEFNRKKPPTQLYNHPAFASFIDNHINSMTQDFETGGCSPIESVWKQRISDNPRLFNATKFRVHSIENAGNDLIVLNLGVTDYKEFLGTNWAPYASQLQFSGKEVHENSQAFLSDALGVGASVITHDNFLMFLCRSEHCAEAPLKWDVPGGHAEPKELIGDVPLQDIDIASLQCEKVVHEIFDSILREVTDEVNIPREQLSAPLYTGTHRNLTSAGRPSLAFQIKCSLTKEEVLSLYNRGNQLEADESTQILFIPFADIPSLSSQQPDVWEKMAPSAKGNLTVLCMAHGVKTL